MIKGVLAKHSLLSLSKPATTSLTFPYSTTMSKSSSAAAASAAGTSSSPQETGPVLFWNADKTTHSYLSQWYPSPFTAPVPAAAAKSSSTSTSTSTSTSASMEFLTTEQYMMYHKAILFNDVEIAEKIMAAKKPAQHKALGRKVKNFNNKVWDANKERIVEEGNWNKFLNAEEDLRLKEKLLETGERELVEASPRDDIWGVGFDAEHALANRKKWGQNLLGKALMRVRERLPTEMNRDKDGLEKL